MSDSRRKLESWLKTIDVGDKSVIDFGGVSLPAKHRTKNLIQNYHILDLKQSRKGAVADYVFDLNKPISGVPRHDVGFCLEVMQFLYNPLQALLNMRNICGELYINFHLFHIPCKGTDYLRYTEGGWRRLMQESGWNVVEMSKRGEDGWFVHAT